jgi:SAM-dependent methyltransferase
MHEQDLQRVAQHWEQSGSWQPGRGWFWLELEAVQRRCNEKVSGNPAQGWVAYTLERHFAGRLPLSRCLSLGCGEGGLERHLAALNAFQWCDACDIAPGSIRRAQELAAAAGYTHIGYSVQDANYISLPPNHYDAVWASGAVHHFQRLEHVFAQVAQALKPDGLFILNEYVGPNRFQFPPYQRQAIQACLDLLPPAYRRIAAETLQARLVSSPGRDLRWLARRVIDKWHDGDLGAVVGRRLRLWRAARSGGGTEKRSANLPTERSVIAVDPSEAVRSAEIVPVLQRYFEIVEYKPLGGALLQFLLADIAGNFERDEAGR